MPNIEFTSNSNSNSPNISRQSQSSSSIPSFATSLQDFNLPAASSSTNTKGRTSSTVYGFSSNRSSLLTPSPINDSSIGLDDGGSRMRRGSLLQKEIIAEERPAPGERDKGKGRGKASQEMDTESMEGNSREDQEMEEERKREAPSRSASNSNSTLFRPRASLHPRPRSAIPSFPFRSSSPSPSGPISKSISNHSLASFSELRRPRSFSGSSDVGGDGDAMQVDGEEDGLSEGARGRSASSGPQASISRPTTPPPPPPQSSSRRPLNRKTASLLPRDKSVLRVAATLKDETRPEDSELASEAKLQRRLNELSLPTSPVARSASASSGIERGPSIWGWSRSGSPFGGGGGNMGGERDLDSLGYGLGYGSEEAMIESDDSSNGLESPPPETPSILLPSEIERRSSVQQTQTQAQSISSSNRAHPQEEEVEMMDNSSSGINLGSFRGGSSLPTSTTPQFAPSTSAGRNGSLWTGFRDRRSRTPGFSNGTGFSSANASPGIAPDAMEVEGGGGTGSSVAKRKYVSDERFEPYANSAKRRAVSPGIGLPGIIRAVNSGYSSSPRREETGPGPVASPSLLATSSYLGSSPLAISTSSNHLPVPTPLSIPSPTTPFPNLPASNSAATHYFSHQHLGHRRSSSATSLKEFASSMGGNSNNNPSTFSNANSPATRPSTPVPPTSLPLSGGTGTASAGPSPSLLATPASSGSGPGYIRSGALGLSLSGNSKVKGSKKSNRRRNTNAGLGMRVGSGSSDVLMDEDEGEEMDEGVRMLGLG